MLFGVWLSGRWFDWCCLGWGWGWMDVCVGSHSSYLTGRWFSSYRNICLVRPAFGLAPRTSIGLLLVGRR